MRIFKRTTTGITIILVCSILCGFNIIFLIQNKCLGHVSFASTSDLMGVMNGREVKAENYIRPKLIDTAEMAYILTSQDWSEIGSSTSVINTDGDNFGLKRVESYADEILALLLMRFIAILQNRSDTPTLPTFPDLSTTTISRTIMNNEALRRTAADSTIPGKKIDALDWPIVLTDKVVYLLRSYIIQILKLYNDVFYHNYKHAHHVFLSANKLLDMMLCEYQWKSKKSCLEMKEEEDIAMCIKDMPKIYRMEPVSKKTTRLTYGIKSDPFLQFSFLFSALVHDVDHKGVGNKKLSLELDPLAILYNDQSVAEQRSLTVAFTYFMKEEFLELRDFLFGNEKKEFARFRSNVIDLVLCTDTSSSERVQIVKSKFQQFFGRQNVRTAKEEEEQKTERSTGRNTNPDRPNAMKAIVVLEQMLKAADIAANMQKWETMLKWNDNLSQELKACNVAERGDDPMINWHQNQIDFFNTYALPLARSLAETKVLEEEEARKLVHNVEENKNQWIIKGRHVVQKMKLK